MALIDPITGEEIEEKGLNAGSLKKRVTEYDPNDPWPTATSNITLTEEDLKREQKLRDYLKPQEDRKKFGGITGFFTEGLGWNREAHEKRKETISDFGDVALTVKEKAFEGIERAGMGAWRGIIAAGVGRERAEKVVPKTRLEEFYTKEKEDEEAAAATAAADEAAAVSIPVERAAEMYNSTVGKEGHDEVVAELIRLGMDMDTVKNKAFDLFGQRIESPKTSLDYAVNRAVRARVSTVNADGTRRTLEEINADTRKRRKINKGLGLMNFIPEDPVPGFDGPVSKKEFLKQARAESFSSLEEKYSKYSWYDRPKKEGKEMSRRQAEFEELKTFSASIEGNTDLDESQKTAAFAEAVTKDGNASLARMNKYYDQEKVRIQGMQKKKLGDEIRGIDARAHLNESEVNNRKRWNAIIADFVSNTVADRNMLAQYAQYRSLSDNGRYEFNKAEKGETSLRESLEAFADKGVTQAVDAYIALNY